MSKPAPKISVIIPAYNAEQYIEECLETVMNQTLENIEIICVDDGSTDSTGKIIDDYGIKDCRIKALHIENSGQSVARNKGMEISKGEFLGFVDSDDFIDKRMFESMYHVAQKYGSDVVITNIYLYMNSTKLLAPYRDMVRFFHLEREKYFEPTDFPDIVKNIGVWDKIYRRSFVEKNRLLFPVGKIYEDHLFSFQSIVLAKYVSIISEPLYYYRKDVSESITGREVLQNKHKGDFLIITRSIKDFLVDQGKYINFAKDFLDYQFEFALFHQSNIRSRIFFKFFFQEMRQMTLDDDYRIIFNQGLSRHKWYAERLQKNQFNECYFTLRIRRISIYQL